MMFHLIRDWRMEASGTLTDGDRWSVPGGSRPPGTSLYCCGSYQDARPSCRRAAASVEASAPRITWVAAFQVSFSRFGVPRDRIWYVDRIELLHSPRYENISCARGSSSVTSALDSGKNPGKAFA